MSQLRIFLVEDDPWFGESLKHHLSLNPDYLIWLFQSASECLKNLHLKPDLISVDFGLPDMTGDLLLKKIHDFDNSIPVIVTSGQEDISVAVNFLKIGAKDYIIKDENTKNMLWNSILKISETIELKKEVEDLKEQLEKKFIFEKTIIGQSDALKGIFVLLDKAIKSNINVSISGETGTGKEVVAKAIHYNSDRKRKPFIAVNMAAIPNELVESELFGYEKGAFTGAQNRRIGKFEEANGGTLFLDEIAEMDLNLQSKILRALQEKEIVRVGGNEPVKFDARIITATHKRLSDQVKKGEFREDLFYRIIGLPIDLPPLRERGGDVLLLSKFFLDSFCKENNLNPISISNTAKNKLLDYHYPGNVRELKSIIEIACVMCDGVQIIDDDINFINIRSEELVSSSEKTLKEYTNEIIIRYLHEYKNDVLMVAKKLDIGKSTIYNLIKNTEFKKNDIKEKGL